jgi:hypothetical protein
LPDNSIINCLIWNNNSTIISSLASMRWRLQIWPNSSKGTTKQLLDSLRDSEKSETNVVVWTWETS